MQSKPTTFAFLFDIASCFECESRYIMWLSDTLSLSPISRWLCCNSFCVLSKHLEVGGENQKQSAELSWSASSALICLSLICIVFALYPTYLHCIPLICTVSHLFCAACIQCIQCWACLICAALHLHIFNTSCSAT